MHYAGWIRSEFFYYNMKIRNLAIIINLLFITFLGMIFSCKEKEVIVSFTPEEFAGNWNIYKMTFDGVITPEWEDVALIMLQTDENSGIYQMPDSPVDSIWSTSGTWSKTDNPHQFITENGSKVTIISIANDTLILGKSIQIEDDCIPMPDQGIDCILPILGNLTFNLVRNN